MGQGGCRRHAEHRGTPTPQGDRQDSTQRRFGAGRTFPTALEQVPEADGGGAQQLVPQRVAAPHLQVQVALRRDVPEGGDTKTGAMAAAPCEGQQEGAGEEGATAIPPPRGHGSQARGHPSSQEPWGSPQCLCQGAGRPPAPQRGFAGTYRTRISFQSSSELPICFPVFLVSLGSPSPATST